MTVFTKLKLLINLDLNPLATPGGEGAVYKIINCPQYPNHCVKILHKLKRTTEKKCKIEYMIQNKPTNLSTPHSVLCWPIEMVYDETNIFVGFIMPLALVGSEKLYELTLPKVSLNLSSLWGKFDRASDTGLKNRLKLCVNIAITVHNIHSLRKYFIIDFKPQNILIDIQGNISITDIDSFHISSATGDILHKADVITHEYAPIEYHLKPQLNENMHESWDRFSMAVSFYEILLGVHPFAASCIDPNIVAESIADKIKNGLFVHGKKKSSLGMIPPPHNRFNYLPENIKLLFYRALESNTDPSHRPSAEEWGKVLYTELSIK